MILGMDGWWPCDDEKLVSLVAGKLYYCTGILSQ